MFNDLMEAISARLSQVFGDGYKIYTEKPQDLVYPCFLITVLNPSQEQLIGARYDRNYPFDIQFFPAAVGSVNEMMTAADKLMDELDLVTMVNGDQIRGNKINCEMKDNILHFFVNYKMVVIQVTDTAGTEMDSFTIETKI